ncbi:8545_t:CDS:2 [Funneliformis caledonium]|uniref:8545_t:CDS:1 n=1 Tax=Funneliformis caledonium TaxID=1117310 RepID=A0A9N8V5L5_9GLOM|nr:8545_t:CDS:2 [Funneliformis caledonium]
MLKNILTIFITIFVILLAVSYKSLYDSYILLGFSRAPVKSYDGGKCRRIEDVEACEDIHIHHRTGYAFMACGSEYERLHGYFPPIDIFNSSHHIRDTPQIYDINKDNFIPLVLKNYPPEEDFISHGFGIYEDPENENKLYMFFINHKKTGSVVEKFEHILHTKELIHLETIEHELIKTPNDVVPVSKHEFYFTNDHYYRQGFLKIIERFHSSITNETKIVVDGLRYANGINTNWDYSLIYVSAPGGGEVNIYERNKNSNELRLKERIFTGYLGDNISVDDITGELYLAILRISNNTEEDKFYGVNYSKKVILEDDGNLYNMASVSAVDRKRNVLLVGSFVAKGILRCDGLEL